jgi:hypothetical protein
MTTRRDFRTTTIGMTTVNAARCSDLSCADATVSAAARLRFACHTMTHDIEHVLHLPL